MKTQQTTRSDQIGAWIRTGLVSASFLKPVLDAARQSRAPRQPAAKPAPVARGSFEEYLPLTQAQIESLAHALTERMDLISQQARALAGRAAQYPAKVDRRVWWAAGASLGFAIVGAVAFTFARRRLTRVTSGDDLVELPTANGQRVPAERLRGIVNRLARRDATSSAATSPATSAVGVQTSTQFIGNIRTMAYHRPESDHLPLEDHRVYFQTEQEAIDAGYHLASGE